MTTPHLNRCTVSHIEADSSESSGGKDGHHESGNFR